VYEFTGHIANNFSAGLMFISYKHTLLLFSLTLSFSLAFAQQKSISNSIPAPNGYTRKEYPAGSFSHWVQSLPVKKEKTILQFDGTLCTYEFYNNFAVVDIPLLFKSDLEQCADFCMRFWAEYHKTNNKLDSLYLFDYSGNKKLFRQSNQSFREFLKQAFAYSNSYSIKKGCREIPADLSAPGDMVVQNKTGGIGHVSMIVDVCESKEGKRLYLIGYSFMPAQEFHIEKADDKYGVGGWFTIEGYFEYLSDYLDFGEPVLRRF